MDENRFWAIMEAGTGRDPEKVESWEGGLLAELGRLTAEEIAEWDWKFDALVDRAYLADLWGAAYLIDGGRSDDGFIFFRSWLVGMGRDVYEKALADPDTLAELGPLEQTEAETYVAAPQAWAAKTGRPEADFPSSPLEPSELDREPWDYDDDSEMRRRFPRLWAIYAEGDVDDD